MIKQSDRSWIMHHVWLSVRLNNLIAGQKIVEQNILPSIKISIQMCCCPKSNKFFFLSFQILIKQKKAGTMTLTWLFWSSEKWFFWQMVDQVNWKCNNRKNFKRQRDKKEGVHKKKLLQRIQNVKEFPQTVVFVMLNKTQIYSGFLEANPRTVTISNYSFFRVRIKINLSSFKSKFPI